MQFVILSSEFFNSMENGNNCEAGNYIHRDTAEFYAMSHSQYTIPQRNDSYEGVLNEKGLEYYEKVKKIVDEGNFTGTFTNARRTYVQSGFWGADSSSPFYDPEGPAACLNSFDNMCIEGNLNGKTKQTSIVIFHGKFDKTTGWVFTKSGSLYKVEYERYD